MSGDVFFYPSPSRSQCLIPIHAPRFSQVLLSFPYQFHQLFPFPTAVIPAITIVSSHLLLYFMDIVKQITSKLTTNISILVWKQLKIKFKIRMSKLGHFSPVTIFLPTVYVLRRHITLFWVGNGKVYWFIPSHSHQAIPMLFPIPAKSTAVLRILLGFPWDHPRDIDSSQASSVQRIGWTYLDESWGEVKAQGRHWSLQVLTAQRPSSELSTTCS